MADTTLNIKDFPSLSSANDADNILLAQSGGNAGKVSVGLLKAAIQSGLTGGITPSIVDGYWYIGDTDTGVLAEGQTPVLRMGTTGLEWKYENQPDEAYQALITYAQIQEDILEYEVVDDTDYPEIFNA